MKKIYIPKFIKLYSFIIIIIILFIFIFIISSYYKNIYSINKDYSQINLNNINKLMIVAHPDDELLWGGSHLIDDNYLVVCITCGTKKERVEEFVRVMHKTNDKYIMLGYPDKTNNERDNWEEVSSKIKKDLQEIISLKDWNLIVTHNPDGEYGHLHHKLTSEFVTNLVSNKNKLYYFGYYHSKKTIADYYDEMIPISDKNIKIKKELIGYYKSQSFIQTTFDHIYNYEEWVKSSEWSDKQ